MKHCVHCQAILTDTAQFCGACGGKQPAAEPEPVVPVEPVSAEPVVPAAPSEPAVSQWAPPSAGAPTESPVAAVTEPVYSGEPVEPTPPVPSEWAPHEGTGQFDLPIEPTSTEPVHIPPAPVYTPPQPVYTPPQPPIQPVYIPPSSGVTEAASPVRGVVRALGRSPLFLVAVAIFTVSLLVSLVQVLTQEDPGGTLIALLVAPLTILRSMGADFSSMGDVTPIFETIEDFGLVFDLLALVPTLALAVGLWLVFTQSCLSGKLGMGTAGLTVIKIVSMFNMIWSLLVTFLGELGFIILFAELTWIPEGAVIFMVFTMVMMVLLCTLVVFFWLRIVYTVDGVKDCLLTGRASGQISLFAAVICFLYAVLQLLLVLISLASLTMTLVNGGSVNVLELIPMPLHIATLICFGVFLMKAKIRLSNQTAVEEQMDAMN